VNDAAVSHKRRFGITRFSVDSQYNEQHEYEAANSDSQTLIHLVTSATRVTSEKAVSPRLLLFNKHSCLSFRYLSYNRQVLVGRNCPLLRRTAINLAVQMHVLGVFVVH
jgi:hypothetical protein